jgi:hypothetical protein
MLLEAPDIVGSQVEEAFRHISAAQYLVQGIPQEALHAWRKLTSRAADEPVPELSPYTALGAMKVAMFLHKGIPECAQALNHAAPAPDFGKTSDIIAARLLTDTEDITMADIRRQMFLARGDAWLQPLGLQSGVWQFHGVHVMTGVTLQKIKGFHGIDEATVMDYMAQQGCLGVSCEGFQDVVGFTQRAMARCKFTKLCVVGESRYCPQSMRARAVFQALHHDAILQVSEIAFEPGLMHADDFVACINEFCKFDGVRTIKLPSHVPMPVQGLAALPTLTELEVHQLPSGFHLPHLKVLSVQCLGTEVLHLPALEELHVCPDFGPVPGLRQMTQIKALNLRLGSECGPSHYMCCHICCSLCPPSFPRAYRVSHRKAVHNCTLQHQFCG